MDEGEQKERQGMNTLTETNKRSDFMSSRNLSVLILCFLVLPCGLAAVASAQSGHDPVPTKAKATAPAPAVPANPGKTPMLIKDAHGVDHYIMVGGEGREAAQAQRGSQSADFPTKPAASRAPGRENPEMQKPAALRAGADGTPVMGHTDVTVKQLHDRMRQRKQEQSDRLRSEQEQSQQQSEGDNGHPQ
jgi:hypothetical protein